MATSETTKEISAALAKAQAELVNPKKNSKANYGYYTSLDDGLDVIRPILAKHGISLIQTTHMEGDILMMVTRLTYGNEWMASEYPVIKFPAKPQDIGSASTYSRRYSLFALVGVAGEPDDDGKSANTAPVPANKSEKAVQISVQESKASRDAMITAINQQPDLATLKAWAVKNDPEFEKLHEADKSLVSDAYNDRGAELKSAKAKEAA